MPPSELVSRSQRPPEQMSADQKMKKILLLTAATAASTGIAQDTEPAPEYNTAVQLPELVVTATRTPTPTAKTAATIATISKSDSKPTDSPRSPMLSRAFRDFQWFVMARPVRLLPYSLAGTRAITPC